MAGVIMPNGYIALTNSAGDFAPIQSIAAGKAESCCVMACLAAGAADAYCSIYLYDPAATPSAVSVLFYEPVRYRQPGGNPVLLQDFIVTAGQHLYVTAHTAGVTINFTLFNRWLFDA